MKNRLLLCGFLFCFPGCNKKESPEPQPQITREAVAKADSLQRLAALHRGFVGVHSHGKSLKVHAHQNPGKKVRVFKKQKQLAPLLRAAMKKENEEREKRIKKILKEKRKNQ